MLLFENRFIYSAENISESFPAFQQICHTFKLKDPSGGNRHAKTKCKKKKADKHVCPCLVEEAADCTPQQKA